jgi:hypothetical protein
VCVCEIYYAATQDLQTGDNANLLVLSDSARCECLTAVMLKIRILWDVIVCLWVSGEWLSTFRGIVVSLSLSGCCIGCWTLGNVNTERFSETSENTRPAKQCHIPEDITTLVSSGYHRGHGTLYYHFSA